MKTSLLLVPLLAMHKHRPGAEVTAKDLGGC